MAARLPAAFRVVRLELAREAAHPAGDAHIGYTLTAPLDQEGRIDADLWREHREACTVVRFRSDAASDHGVLRRRPGGSWAFHYEFGDGVSDDDPGYRLGDHKFAPGEYVTVQEDAGAHTYRVAAVSAP